MATARPAQRGTFPRRRRGARGTALIRFLDATALVKRYVREEGSALVLRSLKAGPVAISRLTEVEVASAVCRRCREGALSLPDRDRILDRLERECQAFLVVDLEPSVVDRARGLLAAHRLRARDAIQLASALVLAEVIDGPVLFVGFDDALSGVAREAGLRVAERGRA